MIRALVGLDDRWAAALGHLLDLDVKLMQLRQVARER
jgi:hypothetical protein